MDPTTTLLDFLNHCAAANDTTLSADMRDTRRHEAAKTLRILLAEVQDGPTTAPLVPHVTRSGQKPYTFNVKPPGRV